MSDQSTAPAAEVKPWAPPTADTEFEFSGPDSIPEWADKGWASYANGPALAVPAGDLFGTGPYHTKTARVGDTVRFVAATPSKAPHFEIIEGEPEEGEGVKRPPAYTNASLEDMLKTGWISADDLGEVGKAEVISRSPGLKALIEDGAGAPEAVSISEVIKTS